MYWESLVYETEPDYHFAQIFSQTSARLCLDSQPDYGRTFSQTMSRLTPRLCPDFQPDYAQTFSETMPRLLAKLTARFLARLI